MLDSARAATGATTPAEPVVAPRGRLARTEATPASRPAETKPPLVIPPPPAGVTELKFSEFFEPVGSRGLSYTERLKSLDGRQVRLLGYMVKQEIPAPGLFLLAPVPVKLEEDEMGLADDLPAGVVHVLAPTNAPADSRHLAGLLAVTGTLQLGTREEADGRRSSVRLMLATPLSLTNRISDATVPAANPAL